jgi:hypothetical protein
MADGRAFAWFSLSLPKNFVGEKHAQALQRSIRHSRSDCSGWTNGGCAG